jgi:DNA-binding NtrC family response regulator
MSKEVILWADDEIDLLKPHILFLQNKGYEIVTVTNGRDALDALANRIFDLIMLDENMPGLTGLETLSHIKEIDPNVPVVMVTKSEEENIMDQAIGSKIADYLIKPVNPNQILLTLKKNIHRREIVHRGGPDRLPAEFTKISQMINSADLSDDWITSTAPSCAGSSRCRVPTPTWTRCCACRRPRPMRLSPSSSNATTCTG